MIHVADPNIWSKHFVFQRKQ